MKNSVFDERLNGNIGVLRNPIWRESQRGEYLQSLNGIAENLPTSSQEVRGGALIKARRWCQGI